MSLVKLIVRFLGVAKSMIMSKRGVVALSGAVLLLGSLLLGSFAFAASRQNGAALDQGDIDQAIADDSEAIKRAPQNIAGYVDRAQAYFRKGDRDRAIVDFAVADRLDAAKVDEIAGENPAFGQLAAMARGAPTTAAAASTAASPGSFCPTRETAHSGYALVNLQQRRKQQVNPSNGDVVTNEYFVEDERAMSATYYKGLLIVFASFLSTYINSYDIDYTRLTDYRVGEQTLYHASSMTLDGKVRNYTVERRVAAQEKLAVGECAFDTVVIETQSLYPDGTKTMARSNFSPTLGMSLRLVTAAEGSEPIEVSYDRIVPLRR